MFTSPLPDAEDYRIFFSEYSKRHFIKRFAKDYPGKQWLVTQDSIFQDLKRIHALQNTQQVDQLKDGEGCRLVKYDFAVAKTNISPKASGNRCVLFLNTTSHRLDVLLVYAKTDLPKNCSETQYICICMKQKFPELWKLLY